MSELAVVKRAVGYPIYYTDDGNGVPLLFIHGWLTSHRVWSLQAPLAAGFRVITLDLRGHGNSAGAEFSYSACCEDIALLLDHLGLDSVIMIGWSMGAQIAIKSYHALKKIIAGMVLVGGTPQFCRSNDFLHGVAPSEARSMALRIRKDYTATTREFFSRMFSQEEAGLDMRSLANRVVGRLPSPEIALFSLKELINSDLRADLPLITAPVLLVHGGADKICLPGASRYMAEKIPAAEMELIPSAGHAPFLVNPDAFNRRISGFVKVVHG